MIPRKAILDTNVYIGWLNRGLHEELMLGRGLVRYLSAVVLMELRAGAVMLPARRAVDHLARAYAAGGRIVAPSSQVYDEAGRMLRQLKELGREVRRASLVNDVLIALTARTLGATVFSADQDHDAIRSLLDYRLERVAPGPA
jgi:predicted nucleic acid-binding protein